MTGISLFVPSEQPADGTVDNVQVGDGTGENVRVGDYIAEGKRSTRFRLLVSFVACGASFRITTRQVRCKRYNSGISVYSVWTDVVASNYTRVVCTASLQLT